MANRYNPKIKHRSRNIHDEYFALVQNSNTDPYSLDANAYYNVGTITTAASDPNYMFANGQTNLYGGNTVCKPYPKNIYQIYSPTAGDNAVCKITDLDLYTLGTTCSYDSATNGYSQTGTLKADSLLDQIWTATTGTSGITVTQAKNGGKSCSLQYGNTVSTAITKRVINTNPSCSNANAVCSTDLTRIYKDPGVSPTTCTTTDNISWYRKWTLNNAQYLDNIANGITITPKISPTMGLSCSAQITANTTLYPVSTYIGTGITSPSYCAPVNGICNDVVESNKEGNYIFSGPKQGSTLIPVDATFTMLGNGTESILGNIGGKGKTDYLYNLSLTTNPPYALAFGPYTSTPPSNGGLSVLQVMQKAFPNCGPYLDLTSLPETINQGKLYPAKIVVNKPGFKWATKTDAQTACPMITVAPTKGTYSGNLLGYQSSNWQVLS